MEMQALSPASLVAHVGQMALSSYTKQQQLQRPGHHLAVAGEQ
jgi:hypothetical protein